MLILQLALQAIDDGDAWVVMHDWLLENDWVVRVDRNRRQQVLPDGNRTFSPIVDITITVDGDVFVWSGPEGPGDQFARALAAVLLFREWDLDRDTTAYPWATVRASLLPGSYLDLAFGADLDRIAGLCSIQRVRPSIQATGFVAAETDLELRSRVRERLLYGHG